MKKQLTFYFIRHGRTVWNEQGLMQGSGDSPLTEEGIKSAVKLSKLYKMSILLRPIRVVYNEPLTQPIILLAIETFPYSNIVD